MGYGDEVRDHVAKNKIAIAPHLVPLVPGSCLVPRSGNKTNVGIRRCPGSYGGSGLLHSSNIRIRGQVEVRHF